MKKFKKIITTVFVFALFVCISTCFFACTNEGENVPENVTKDRLVKVQYVADGVAARTLLLNSESGIDFAVVGEPAATAFLNAAPLKLNASMNMQTEYAKISGKTTYPQAGLFVKNEVANNTEFMTALFTALGESKAWVTANPSEVDALAKEYLYESASFPAKSIPNCAINATALTDETKDQIVEFLKNVAPKDGAGDPIDWDGQRSNLFSAGNANADTKTEYRFTAPEGTPALAILRMPVNNTVLCGKNMTYEIVAPSNIAAEMSTGKSDLVIMPVNAGANLIRQGAEYTLVSVAVDGSLYMIGRTENGGTISFDDLNGKQIACIGKTGVPGLIFRYVMQKNGFVITEE